MTRVALCIHGSVRNVSFSHIFDNLRTIGDHVDAFVALRLVEWNKSGRYIRYQRPILEDHPAINIIAFNTLYDDATWVNCTCPTPYMQGFMNRFQSLQSCASSVIAHEHRLRTPYDAVVAMRSDLTFTSPMYSVSRLRYLWPEQGHRAYVDRDHFWIVPRRDLRILLNPLTSILNQCKTRSSCFQSKSEYYLRTFFYDQNISCVPSSFKQIRIHGAIRRGGASMHYLIHDCRSNERIQKSAITVGNKTQK